MNYTISRYEEKSDSLFICINSNTKPVYIEHFFTEEERATPESRKETIERLVAELEIKADEYVEPEKAVSKVEEAKAIVLDTVKIKEKKDEIKAERLEPKEEVIEPVVEEIIK